MPDTTREENDVNLKRVKTSEIKPYPDQPRTHFNQSSIRDLGKSIKSEGQKKPISVIEVGSSKKTYIIIDGERRWRACKLAGVERMYVVVDGRIKNAKDHHFSSLILNFFSEPHTHMEISNAVAKTRKEGRSNEDIMVALGKSIAWVSSYLSLQRLDKRLQDLMHPDVPDEKRLRFTEAVKIAAVSDKKIQMTLYKNMLQVNTMKARKALLGHKVDALPAHKLHTTKGRKRDDLRSFIRFFLGLNNDLSVFLMKPEKSLQAAFARIDIEKVREMEASITKCQNRLSELLKVLKKRKK